MKSAVGIIALSMIKGIGNKRICNFVKKSNFNTIDFLKILRNKLTNNQFCEFESNIERAKIIYDLSVSHNINVISMFDKEFPSSLYETKDPCVLLYYIGDIKLLSSKCITVIGTRNPSESFVEKGRVAVRKLVKENYTIVSGLALGSDKVAHEECLLSGGKTIAVMPCSLDKIIPSRNTDLAETIVRNSGLLISEYQYKTPYDKYAYAKRDRIQAYLSDNILVIESTDEGGTMIAVEDGIHENKNVFALLGNKLKLINSYLDPNDDSFIQSFKTIDKNDKNKSTNNCIQTSLFDIDN